MIIKCLIIDDDEIIRATLEHYVNQTDGLELVDSVDNAITALSILKSKEVDLLLLDVEMPEMSGIELLDILKDAPHVILVTSKEGYAVKAFEYNVIDYLLKPVQYSRFVKAINKIKDIDKSVKPLIGDEFSIYIKSDLKYVKVNVKEICMIEAMADYVMFFVGKDKKYIVHSTMKALESKLPSDIFVRVHRSYIINTLKINSVDTSIVEICGNRVPIGASYRASFFERIKTF